MLLQFRAETFQGLIPAPFHTSCVLGGIWSGARYADGHRERGFTGLLGEGNGGNSREKYSTILVLTFHGKDHQLGGDEFFENAAVVIHRAVRRT